MTTCEIHRKKIYLTARGCVGFPFRHQGRCRKSGFDCVGLVVYVAQRVGGASYDRMDYRKIPTRRAISCHAEAAGFYRVSAAEMKPGDVVILRMGRWLEHAAVLSDRGIIHACEKYGRVVEHRLSDDWRSRIIAAYAFPPPVTSE